jgi:hypothetical protein
MEHPNNRKAGQGNVRTIGQTDKGTLEYRDLYRRFHLALAQELNGFDIAALSGRSFKQGWWLTFKRL